jgi:hypothetical protein
VAFVKFYKKEQEMKVIKRKYSKIYDLGDFYVKDLEVVPKGLGFEKEQIIQREKGKALLKFYSNIDTTGECIELAVDFTALDEFGNEAGIYLTRYYCIPLSDLKEDTPIKTYEGAIYSIVDALNSEGIGFRKFGTGMTSDWIVLSNGNRVQFFIGNDGYMKIIVREDESKEEMIGEEQVIDKIAQDLGL